EELLSRLKDQREKVEGTLKIFFGYAAGVGKTYTRLDDVFEPQFDGVRPEPARGVIHVEFQRRHDFGAAPAAPLPLPRLRASRKSLLF
ncbi:hypothetical protein, partial [Cloacibacillus evryensis]|uniref:hypothetical protein n=1 Tax=Cloacibacillus evryensis TaxID=508460 RepID=UPI00210C5E57